MFAITSLIQSHAFSSSENEMRNVSKQSKLALFFDGAIVVLATLATLRIFPKDFMTKNRITALQTTAIIACALDLLTLLPLCASKITPNNDHASQPPISRRSRIIDNPPPLPNLAGPRWTGRIYYHEEYDAIFDQFISPGSPLPPQYFPRLNIKNFPTGSVEREKYLRMRDHDEYLVPQRYNYIMDQNLIDEVKEFACTAAFKSLFAVIVVQVLFGDRTPPHFINYDLFEQNYATAYEHAKAACLRHHRAQGRPVAEFSINQYLHSPLFIHTMVRKFYPTAERSGNEQRH